MTAQSSTIKKPGFLNYFLYRLGRLKFLTALLALLEFFTFPYYTLILDRYAELAINYDPANKDLTETLGALSHGFNWIVFAAALFGSMIVSLIIILSAFRYLHNKQYVNMDLSLPVTHTQRFFGDMLASVVSIFVPHLLSVLTGFILSEKIRSYEGFEDFAMQSSGHSFDSFSLMLDLSLIQNILAVIIVVFLLLYFMTLFVISTTGKTVTAVLMPIAVQVAVPAVILFIWEIARGTAYGTDIYGTGRFGDVGLFSVLSPINYVVSYLGYRLTDKGPLTLILLVLYLAALCAGSYILQKHRRAERTGEAFALRYARHTYTALYVLAASTILWWRILCPNNAVNSMLFRYSAEETPAMLYIFIWLFVSLVIFVVAELVGGGKLRNLPFTAIRFAVTTACCAGLCAAVTLTGGFGEENYIPPESDIDGMNVYIHNGYDNLHSDSGITYEDITAIHKKILAEKPAADKNDAPMFDLHINYHTLDNRNITRLYRLPQNYIPEVYAMFFRNGGLGHTVGYKIPQLTRYIDRVDVKTGEITEEKTEPSDVYITISGDSDRTKYHIPIDTLCEAIQADASDVTFEQLYLSAYGSPAYLNVVAEYANSTEDQKSYTIYPFFERTVKQLNEYGIELFGTTEWHDAFIAKAGDVIWGLENSTSLMFNTSRSLRRLGMGSAELEKTMSMTAEKSYYTGNERYYLLLVSEEAYRTNTGMQGYTYLPIPEMYTDEARRIYENAPEDETAQENLQSYGSIYGEQ